MEREQIECDAELTVVPLAGFIATPEILLELLFCLPCSSIDALEHRTVALPTPVGTSNGEQLECPNLSRALNVWSATEIFEIAVAIGGDVRRSFSVRNCFCSKIVHDLNLERLIRRDESGASISKCVLCQLKYMIGGNALRHLSLNSGKIVWGEGSVEKNVIVEAVSDCWADAKLCAREEAHDRLCHHMRS